MFAKTKLGLKVLKNNMGFSTPPYQLNFAITFWCNSRCTFCKIWEMKPKNELTVEEIDKFTKNASYIQWVRLTGGEPFVRPDYVEIVKAFYKNCPDIYLISSPTNAILPDQIYNKIVKVLEFFDRKYIITVSLDGDKEMHDRVRGIEGNFDSAMKLYLKLKELKKKHKNFDVFFGHTIYPENVGIFEKMVANVKEFVPDIKVNDFHVNIFQVSETYFHNEMIKTEDGYPAKAREEIEKVLQARQKHRFNPINRIETKYLELAKKYLQTGKTPIPCNILDTSCFMDSWGNIFPCIIYNNKLGNIRDYDYELKKIFDLEITKQTKIETMNLQCPNCWTPCEAHDLILSNWLKV